MKLRVATTGVWILMLFALGGWAFAILLWMREALPEPYVFEKSFGGQSRVGASLAVAFERECTDLTRAGAAVGFCVLDEKGETLFASPLAKTALCPASALKTLTTGAALAKLGPEFRFETRLVATAKPDQGGRLAGDLILVGSGDPTLTRDDLDRLVESLSGVGVITGEVRVDASAFPENPVNDHWNWGDLGNAYGAGAFGVNLDRNRMIVRFQPGSEVGERSELLGSDPAPSGLEWTNHVTTESSGTGDGVVVYAEPYGRRVTLRGTVPAGSDAFSVRASLADPPAFAASYLRSLLEARSIEILGEETAGAGDSLLLATHRSAPLAEIIDHLHRVSDNLEAQCLFLTLGRLSGTDPAEAVRTHWEKQGIDFAGLRMLDGSGLARANTIRPIDLARVNFRARHGAHGDRFLQSLNESLDGHVRAKAGAMSGVRSDVGFVTLPDGRECTFALIANAVPPDLDFWQIRHRLLTGLMDLSP